MTTFLLNNVTSFTHDQGTGHLETPKTRLKIRITQGQQTIVNNFIPDKK